MPWNSGRGSTARSSRSPPSSSASCSTHTSARGGGGWEGRDTTTERSAGEVRVERKEKGRKGSNDGGWRERETEREPGQVVGEGRREVKPDTNRNMAPSGEMTKLPSFLRHQQDQFRSAAVVKDSFGKCNNGHKAGSRSMTHARCFFPSVFQQRNYLWWRTLIVIMYHDVQPKCHRPAMQILQSTDSSGKHHSEANMSKGRETIHQFL